MCIFFHICDVEEKWNSKKEWWAGRMFQLQWLILMTHGVLIQNEKENKKPLC